MFCNLIKSPMAKPDLLRCAYFLRDKFHLHFKHLYLQLETNVLFFARQVARNIWELKKTTKATSCRTPPNNGVNEQNNETACAKYNLVSVLKITFTTFASVLLS